MFHSVLLSDIRSRLVEWDDHPCIADIFLGFLDYLKVFFSEHLDFIMHFFKVIL